MLDRLLFETQIFEIVKSSDQVTPKAAPNAVVEIDHEYGTHIGAIFCLGKVISLLTRVHY
jgi:hypothetical protein